MKVSFWHLLWLIALVWMAAVYGLIFLWAPEADVPEGIAQKIFYIHVPLSQLALLTAPIVFIGSIFYLWRGWRFWDILAYCMAEMGLLFTSLSLITGILWGKPAWLQWWVWDPRLTTTLILWILYVAYLLLRAYSPPAQAARFAAVLGTVIFIDALMVYFAVRWWRTLHPLPLEYLDPTMKLVRWLTTGAFTLLFILIAQLRISLRQLEQEIVQHKMEGL